MQASPELVKPHPPPWRFIPMGMAYIVVDATGASVTMPLTLGEAEAISLIPQIRAAAKRAASNPEFVEKVKTRMAHMGVEEE